MLTLSKEPETEKFEIRFTIYASPGTLEYELLTYLKKNKSMSRDRLKEMAMAALTGYYLPPARINTSTVTKEQRHLIVLEGIQRLRIQQQYFQELGGLCEAASAEQLKSIPLKANGSQVVQAELAGKKEPEFDPEQMF